MDNIEQKGKELGAKHIITIPRGDGTNAVGYLKKITRVEVSMMHTMTLKKNGFEAMGLVLKSILIDGSDQDILTDDDLFISAIQTMAPLLNHREGNLLTL